MKKRSIDKTHKVELPPNDSLLIIFLILMNSSLFNVKIIFNLFIFRSPTEKRSKNGMSVYNIGIYKRKSGKKTHGYTKRKRFF